MVGLAWLLGRDRTEDKDEDSLASVEEGILGVDRHAKQTLC